MASHFRSSRACPLCAGGLLALLAVAGVAAPASAQPVFRSGVDLVTFGVTVLDEDGGLVTDLSVEDFVLREDGEPQEIVSFASGSTELGEQPPLHLGLLLDTSGSMEQDLDLARTAAVRFLNALPHAADITLVDFDTEVRVARYGQADFPRLVERIRMREPEGWTALYDALGVYLDGAAGQEGRKVLVMYTDGGDTRSAMSFSNALDLLRASDVTVYAIGFVEHQFSGDRMELRRRLMRVAELTGGAWYFPRILRDLDGVFDEIRDEILAQYTLGYVSTNARMDGSWRKVEVEVVGPRGRGLKVRTREGYYALYRDEAAADR